MDSQQKNVPLRDSAPCWFGVAVASLLLESGGSGALCVPSNRALSNGDAVPLGLLYKPPSPRSSPVSTSRWSCLRLRSLIRESWQRHRCMHG